MTLFQVLIVTASRPALGPTQPPIQWVPGALSPGIKWPEREANYSPPSTTAVKNFRNYISTAPYVFRALYLVKHRDNFILFCLILTTINTFASLAQRTGTFLEGAEVQSSEISKATNSVYQVDSVRKSSSRNSVKSNEHKAHPLLLAVQRLPPIIVTWALNIRRC
jgi:hypothetical protein